MYNKADTVHHIKHLRKYPTLALKDDNLVSLCSNCHYEIHHTIIYKEQLNEERW